MSLSATFTLCQQNLADENPVEIYKNEFLPHEIPEALVELLKKLNKKPYAGNLSAVASLGHSYLTTAFSWNDEENYAVLINQRIDAGRTVIVLSSSIEGSKKSIISRQCSTDEATEYVDLYVMSILLKNYGELCEQ